MAAGKAILRKQKKAVRDAMGFADAAERSGRICHALAELAILREADRLCLYAPLPGEADIIPLAERLFSEGKKVAFPRVEPGGSRMDFYEVEGLEELSEGSFHVMEPPDDGRPADWPGAPVLVPGLAFSADGFRLGYGKGYYDRYFERFPDRVRIGVAFDCQIAPELSGLCDSRDARMDYVQTESRLYRASSVLSYGQLVERICGASRFGSEPGVVCSAAAMELLGHPESGLKFVHIAGTNGKGSVAAFLNEICVASGIRTGLFTSPHLEDFAERIRMDGMEIPHEDVLRLGRDVMDADRLLAASRGIRLTMFDYCLAIALLYFKERGAELVILETGMGGRLDSTNIIPPPLVAAITRIGMDHTQYLGHTLEAIAAEKAGILKHGSRAVLMDQDPRVLDVLRARCVKLDIPYVVSGEAEPTGIQPEGLGIQPAAFAIPPAGSLARYRGEYYEIGMFGAYQRRNAAAAIDAAKLLRQEGFPITPESLRLGLRGASWPGRMELMSRRPWLLLDGAHNACGAAALAESLREAYPGQKYVIFMGVMADKDYEVMLDILIPLSKKIYALPVEDARALPPERLCGLVRSRGCMSDVCGADDVARIARADPDGRYVVCGSLYLIGAVRRRLRQAAVPEGKDVT